MASPAITEMVRVGSPPSSFPVSRTEISAAVVVRKCRGHYFIFAGRVQWSCAAASGEAAGEATGDPSAPC